MIDVVEQEKKLTRDEAQAVIEETFADDATLIEDGDNGFLIKLRLCSVLSSPDGCPAMHAAGYFRRLAGQFLTAAEDLDIARGRGPEVELEEINDNRRFFKVPGFECVELVVHDAGDEDEALRLAREALASMTAIRPRRPA